MKKILLIDTIHHAFQDILEKYGFEIHDGTVLTRNDIINIVSQFEGIVIRSRFPVDAEFLSSAAALKFIARAGAGMENIDLVYAASLNITCINAPEGNRDAVGEHAVGMLLSLMNRLPAGDKEVRNGQWRREENRGTELSGKTVGIIGFGNMGSAFAEKLIGFGVNVIAFDKYITISSSLPHVKQVDPETIFRETDVLSLHVPLTNETTYMVNSAFLSRFKKNIYLINTARGKIVKTADLASAIRSGKVTGACLDVIEYETSSFETLDRQSIPDDWSYLAGSERVIFSPHVAGWSFESHRKISVVLAQKVLALYNIYE